MDYFVEMSNWSLSESRHKSTQGKCSWVYGLTTQPCFPVLHTVENTQLGLEKLAILFQDWIQFLREFLIISSCFSAGAVLHPMPDSLGWCSRVAQLLCTLQIVRTSDHCTGRSSAWALRFWCRQSWCTGSLQWLRALYMKVLLWCQAQIVRKKMLYTVFFPWELCELQIYAGLEYP